MYQSPSQYSENNPPFVPNIQVLPTYSHLVVKASALVANCAIATAQQTTIRYWVFQILSYNNWNNQDFANAVKFAIDYHMHQIMLTGGAECNFEENTAKALTLFTSHLAMQNNGLLQSLTIDQIASLNMNQENYVHIARVLRDLYNGQSGQSTQFQRPSQSAVFRHGGQTAMPHPAASNVYGGQSQRQGPSSRLGVAHVGSGEVPPITRARPAQKPIVKKNTYGAVIINPISEMDIRYEAAPEPSPVVKQEESESAPAPAPSDVPEIQTEVDAETQAMTSPRIVLAEEVAKMGESTIREYDVYAKEAEMDRQTHAVPYFGEEYQALKPVTRALLEAAVLKEEAEAVSEEVSKSDVWFVEATLDELLNVARVKALGSGKEGFTAHHFHGFVVTPIITRANLKPYFEKMREVMTFADFSRETKAYLKAISEKENSADELRNTIAAITQVDRPLTKLVNYFLREALPEIPFLVSSVVEDGGDVVRELNRSIMSSYLDDFMRFQRAIFETFFKHTRAEGDSFSDVCAYDEAEGVYIDQVAESYSILYIDALPADVKLREFEGRVDIEDNKLIERLLSATISSDRRTISAAHQVLVFLDGSRYSVIRKIYTGMYMIKKL